MKNPFLLILIILLNFKFLVVFAQTSKIDSLQNILQQHTKKDTVRINLLNDFAEATFEIDQEQSIKYAKEALELASSLNFKKGKAESLNHIGQLYFKQGNFILSLEFRQKAIKVYEEIEDKLGVAVCLKNIGILYEKQGNYTLSLEYYHKALKINKEINNKQGKANCLHNIGVTYHIQGNYPLALEYYHKSLKIKNEKASKQQIANCLNNIASIYYEQTDYTSALSYYQKSIKICKEIDYKEGEARGLNNIGELYRLEDDFTKALTYYQKSLKIKKEIRDKNGIARTMNNIGRIYLIQGKYALAQDFSEKALKSSIEIGDKVLILDSYASLGTFYLKTLNFEKALDYTKKSFTIAKELEHLSQQKRIYLQFSEIYTATKNYKKALENYILYKESNDSLFNEKSLRKTSELEYQYKFEKEKQAIELEQQQKDAIIAEKSKHQNILNIVFIFALISLTSLILVILRSFFQKRKANNILRIQKKQIEETNKELILQKEEIQDVAFELEKANKTKDKFFSIIAHDLKSPFNVLLGFSDILLKNHTIIKEEERATYIKIINESTIKTYKLLENLLTWARSQTGIIKFSTEIINISVLINETISLLEEPALNKKIKLVFNDEKDLSVKADKNMIDTVIRNLVSNAIKFTPKGGAIIINSKSVADENNKMFAEISVKDSGVGIPTEIQSKLFKITENVSTKGTEEETGTGLGLILCKEFIDKHNGEIWVESNVDIGCKFVFRIPISQ